MFKNLNEFSKFDNIIVNQENMSKIREKLNVDEKIPVMGIFNECVLAFKEDDSTHYVYFKQSDEQLIHLESYNYERGKLEFLCSFDVDFKEAGNTFIDRTINIKKGFKMMYIPKGQLDYYMNFVVARYTSIIGFFYLVQKDSAHTIKDVSKTISDNKVKSSSIQKQGSYLYRNTIELDDIHIIVRFINPDTLKQIKNLYTKHTESWGVRGHFRKLKSGKKVWIKAYKKGNKSSSEYKAKDYEIQE